MLELNFDPFPTILTERLELRKMVMEDAEDMYLLREEINAMKHLSVPYFKRSREENLESIIKVVNGVANNEFIGWAVVMKGEQKLIGAISFHKIYKANYRAEIGYMIGPQHWNKGLMSEAVKAVLHYGFEEMNLHSVEAHVSPENKQSMHLVEKHSFVKEAYFKDNICIEGRFIDTIVYSLIKNG